MVSNPELALMTKLLKLEGVKVKNYQLTEGIGILLYLENSQKKVLCPHCGKTTDKLHQNHFYVVRDLPLARQPMYLQVNRRQMRCQFCDKIFSEQLEWIKKKRTYTERFKNRIIEEVLETDIKNVAQRNGVSQQEIKTMLRELAGELIEENPQLSKS